MIRKRVKNSERDTVTKTHTHTLLRTHTHILRRKRKGEGLGEMEDHLLAVQFILIQSGGRAEQRVNAAHMHILSTPWGRTHGHTLHSYIQARTHTHC